MKMRKYPVNREFTKTLRHNGNNYTLRSVFDETNDFGFDDEPIKYNRRKHRYGFDNTLNNIFYNLYSFRDPNRFDDIDNRDYPSYDEIDYDSQFDEYPGDDINDERWVY